MNEGFSLVSAEKDDMSDKFNAQLEKEAEALLKKMSQEAQIVISKNKEKIQKLADKLLVKETLDLKEVKEILNIKSE